MTATTVLGGLDASGPVEYPVSADVRRPAGQPHAEAGMPPSQGGRALRVVGEEEVLDGMRDTRLAPGARCGRTQASTRAACAALRADQSGSSSTPRAVSGRVSTATRVGGGSTRRAPVGSVVRIARFTTGDEPQYGVVTGDVDELGIPADDAGSLPSPATRSTSVCS